MLSRFSRLWLFTALGCLLCVGASPAAPSRTETPPPDFTQGGQPDGTHDWTLGATGARGWIWGWRSHTTDARQILITRVFSGSPAEGILERGDVILGVDGKPFADDARIVFAKALTEAEKPGDGKLPLLRWRDGKTDSVTLRLKTLGTYSDTAPYDCAKSKAIFEQGCRVIANNGLDHISIPNDLNALALLASGKKEYLPLLANYAKQVSEMHRDDMASWHYGYANLFLSEYYLATGDPSILPGLRRITMEIASGQSNVGTWGHKFAQPNGICNGYGCMNQPGLVLTVSLVLARKAGIESDRLDLAIERSGRFLCWYVNKGSIPYGDHDPWMEHDDNGKNAIGAILFDLLEDPTATAYFSRMTTAAYNERETGHTGNFFNVLWAMPGVSRTGPLATAAYFQETAWYYDLARAWDGSFVYQGSPANSGGHSYGGWDNTGAYLLSYALPLKSLYITGKQPCAAPALTVEQTEEVIDAGRHFTFWDRGTSYDHLSDSELLGRLSSWSPVVRKRAAEGLAHHEGDFSQQLGAMLDSQDPHARYGACEAIARQGVRAQSTAEKLRRLLSSDDPWLQCLAVGAIIEMDQPTREAATVDLLKLATRQTSGDPRNMVHRAVAVALFDRSRGKAVGTLVASLDRVDRQLLLEAVKSILANEDGRTRGKLQNLYTNLKDDKQLGQFLPMIVDATREMPPSGVMFADGIRLAGIKLLSGLRIREGMPLCIQLVEPDRWGFAHRLPICLECLQQYGGAAGDVLPQLRELRQSVFTERARSDEKDPTVIAIDEAIALIENDRDPPTLRSVSDFADK
ncbi:MAG TPA: DUF6288 domain-containing protein [Thermoguttaceae bacterium]|nr:DUF6288 domain-containing protein [Thermoguttaceae bacterium]